MPELTSNFVTPSVAVQRKTDPLNALGWALCLVGAFSLPALVARVGAITVSDLSFAAAALCFAFARREGARTRARSFLCAFVAAAAAVLLSSYQSSSLTESLLVGVRLLYVFSIWQWCVRRVITDEVRLERLVNAFLCGAAMSSLVAVAQIVAHVEIPGSLVIFGRASGLQGHPNGQGGVLAVALPMALALCFRPRRRMLSSVVVGCSVVGLILSGSVTGMLSAVVGVIVVVLNGKKKFLKLFLLTVTGLLVGLVVQNLERIFPGAASPLKRIADTTGNGVGDSTLTSRLLTDQFAWAHIRADPFGSVGLAGLDGVTYDGQTLTHNLLLLSWYQGGPLLAVAVVITACAAIAASIQTSRRSSPAISAMLSAGVVAALVFAMTGPVLYDRWFWFPLLVAIATASRARAESEGKLSDALRSTA